MLERPLAPRVARPAPVPALVALGLALALLTTPVAGALVADPPAPDHTTGEAASTPGGDCSFPVTRTDATGTAVTVSERPARIVTLNPSAAQTLWEVGARDRVVGISEFAAYLNGTDDLARVNTADGGVSVERTVALAPDLVFAPGTIPNETVDSLRAKGLRVVALETSTSVAGVASKTELIGRLVGSCAGAARTNAWMERNVAAVERAVAAEPRPRALYVFSGEFTAGEGTFIHDVMRTAGLRNVAAEAGIAGYARISREVVRERDPEWLVRNSRDDLPDGPVYRETTAIRENQTVSVAVEYLNQPAPRSIVRAVRTLATTVHPERAADAVYVPRSAAGPRSPTPAPASAPGTATPDATATPTATPTTGAAPGFGALSVPIAGVLAAVAALVRRRRRPRA